MNWIFFAVISWIFFGMERGLKDALRLGDTTIAPSFVMILGAFIALSAPPLPALWGCLILGVVMDLTWGVEMKPESAPLDLLGPYALGMLLAGQLIITIRALMMRRNPLTVAFASFVGAIVCQVVVVAIVTLRGIMGDLTNWDASGQLLARMGAALYTGLVAIIISLLLFPLSGLLGFPSTHPRRGMRSHS